MGKRLQEIKRNYKASLKSMDTEETFDLLFYRPIGYIVALVSAKLGIKPNAITILSIFLGIGAGVLLYFHDAGYIWYNLAGMALLVLADICDSADGQLARLTKQYSRLGRILDGVSGDIWFAVIYVGICLREVATSDFFIAHHWAIWTMAIAAGLCHATQAAMADYYRQFHLLFVKGPEGTELEESAGKLWDNFHALSWRKNIWKKIILLFYANYTSGQEKRTPAMQRLRRTLRADYGSNMPLDERERFRAMSKPLMKYTNILSFNTRAFALFIAIVCLQMPWLYFAFELTILNALLIYMVWRHEKICTRFESSIKNNL